MDRKEALRILNLIGVKSEGQAELRYLQLSARIELMIQSAETPELRKTYIETSRTLEEAYQFLTRRKEAKLLPASSAVGETWSGAGPGVDETREALSQMRSTLSDVEAIRASVEKYPALLEMELAKVEKIEKDIESEKESLSEAINAIREFRATAERHLTEIAHHLECVRQIASEMQKQKRSSPEIATIANGKGRFLEAMTGRLR